MATHFRLWYTENWNSQLSLKKDWSLNKYKGRGGIPDFTNDVNKS